MACTEYCILSQPKQTGFDLVSVIEIKGSCTQLISIIEFCNKSQEKCITSEQKNLILFSSLENLVDGVEEPMDDRAVDWTKAAETVGYVYRKREHV